MAQIIWTESALSDLNEIAEFIALDKPNAASSLVKQVFSSVDKLEPFPELGRTPPELKRSTYREIIVDPCRIFYRTDQGKIYILYVMRGEMRLRRHLIEDRLKNNS
jgi:toxin ParE1/3/4